MFSILILISILIFFYYKLKKVEKFTLNNELYLSMTTIPERLIHPWFLNNIKYLLSLGNYFKIIINIPYYLKRNNEKYIIPNELIKLADKTNRIILHRVKEDYGPITKLYGPLLNNSISDEAAILVLDDDIHYLPNFIKIIFNKYNSNNTNKLYSFCDNIIQGYHSFLFKKKILKPILKFINPHTCFRIDDNFIQLSVKKLNIPIEMVSYQNKTGNFCNINKDIHDNHTPKWDELKWDDRKPMVEKCKNDFITLN